MLHSKFLEYPLNLQSMRENGALELTGPGAVIDT